MEEGVGAISYIDSEWGIKEALQQSNAVFAAFKTHQQYTELKKIVVGDDGKLKSFAAFKRDSKQIIGNYNQQWLRTEYNTTVARARTAVQWNKFQQTPGRNIKWIPSRAAIPDAIHKGYWHTVLPQSDPFWATNFPGNRYNCKCDWALTDDPVTDAPEVEIRPQAGLKENPCISRKVFGDDHPYQASAPRKVKKSAPTAAMRLERKLLLEWAKSELKSTYQLGGSPAVLHTSGIKEILNQPHRDYALKNRILFTLEEVLENAEFIRTDPNTKANPLIRQYHYYKITVNERDSFLVLRELANGERQIYSVVESLQ